MENRGRAAAITAVDGVLVCVAPLEELVILHDLAPGRGIMKGLRGLKYHQGDLKGVVCYKSNCELGVEAYSCNLSIP